VGRRDFISTLSALGAVTAPYAAPPIAAALASASLDEATAPPLVVRGLPRSIECRRLERGLELTVETPDELAIDATLVAHRPLAPRRGVVLATDVSGYASGRRTIELRAHDRLPCARARPHAELRVATVDRAGNRRLYRSAVRLRR
jgi:hypothetical protein